ncbi:MAG: hypothetical protein R2733_16960 [Acidimicrobiales bacterium]
MALGLVAAACGSDSASGGDDAAVADDAGSSDGGSDGGSTEGVAGSLADCPNPIVIQTDWFPESEHGAVYNLTGGEGSVDPESGRFSGPLSADPSITVEVRAGGPFLGDQTTIAVMATDPDILLGYVNTDEAINNYADFPTTAVFAPLDINPQIIMFDPETYPISSWDEVKETGAVIAHFGGATYTEYLVGAGIVDAGQLDGSYDGAPTRFIAEGGALMQQGFATQEPYNYENVFTEWGKPVDFLLIHDAGFEIYQGPLTILDSKLDENRSCLSALVPVLQQSAVDFQNDPAATNAAILQAVTDIDSFWQLTPDGMTNTVSEMTRLNMVGNGPNSTIGDFDMDRVSEVIKVVQEQVPSINVPEGITAEDLVTNEFIDESIGL